MDTDIRAEITDRIPPRETITDRVPSGPSPETKQKFTIYGKMMLMVLCIALGVTLTLAGLVLLIMMAVVHNPLLVIGASSMVGFGIVMTGAGYLWITAPA